MTMRKTIEVISRLAADGAIKEYAIAGAVAALSYIQPFLTEDLDVLVAVAEFDQRPSGLILQSGIESRLAALGYTERSSVGVIVEGWPVQFIPVGSPLDDAALRQATDVELDGFTARFLRPEYWSQRPSVWEGSRISRASKPFWIRTQSIWRRSDLF